MEVDQREIEGKKTNLIMEIEQERAKWTMEKEYLSQQYNDLVEKLSVIQKKNEYLIGENEKLKNENKQKRLLNKSQTLSKNRSFIFGKFNLRDIDDSKSTLTNHEKENSNKKNFLLNKF